MHHAPRIWAVAEAKEMTQLMGGLLEGPLPEKHLIRRKVIEDWAEPGRGDDGHLTLQLRLPKDEIEPRGVEVYGGNSQNRLG